jgi:hypothetical protein
MSKQEGNEWDMNERQRREAAELQRFESKGTGPESRNTDPCLSDAEAGSAIDSRPLPLSANPERAKRKRKRKRSKRAPEEPGTSAATVAFETTALGVPLLPRGYVSAGRLDPDRWNAFAEHITADAVPHAITLFKRLLHGPASKEDADAPPTK